MNNYYKSYQDKYTYCKPLPKYNPTDCCYPHIENKCNNKFEKKCECPVNISDGFTGAFILACGSSLKIFESDNPVEIDMEVQVDGITNEDLCNLKVKVLLQNGNVLEFDLPNPGPPGGFMQNTISFYSKDVCTVTLECESDSGIGCRGTWILALPLRELEKSFKCECPVNELLRRTNEYSLECGNSLKIFESNKPVEMYMFVNLQGEFQQDSCNLKVIVELEDERILEFPIPNPNVIPDITSFNSIAFYSKNVRSIILECESGVGVGCSGGWIRNIVLRGSKIERLSTLR